MELNDRRLWLIDAAGALYALKKTLLWDVGSFEREFLFKAAQEGAGEFLSGQITDDMRKDPEKMVEFMLDIYSQRGHGEFKLEKLDLQNKVAEFSCKDSVEAWAFQVNRDMQRNPVCSYASGLLAYIGRIVFSEGPNDPEIKTAESECAAQGSTKCRFIVGPARELAKRVPRFEATPDSVSEHDLKLNEEILTKNIELQNVNLDLERQVRRRAEELKKSEENYNSLIELSPDAIIIATESGTISSMNGPALRMLGYGPNELNQGRLTVLLGAPDADWRKITWQLEKEGSVNGLDLELVRRDGSRLQAEISARRADLPTGKCIELVARDVTANNSVANLLKEARSEGEFYNTLLSHDMMNYTFSALHFVANLRKSARLSDDDRRSLSIIWKDLQGAYGLASSVRDMSRVKSMSRDEMGIESLQIMILEGAEDAKGMYPDREPRVNFEKSPEPKFVRGHTILSRLFANVIDNAIKFNPSEQPEVDIVVEGANEDGVECWRVSISDRGRGIPDAEKERIFDKFQRLDASVPGNGLGLYVCRVIADACGGSIMCKDRVPGDMSKGSTFVVTLKKGDLRANLPQRVEPPTAPKPSSGH